MNRRFAPTPEQQAVIEHDTGHALVSAVAGAGKTTTVVERVTRLVKNGVEPSRIIAITYNKSAQLQLQGKLKERLAGMKPPEARTFHSIGLAMMKKLIDVGALAPARLETSNAAREKVLRNALKAAWKRAHGASANPTKEITDGFEQFVTRAKADTRPPETVFREGDYRIECAPYVAALAEADHVAARSKIVFFDDLLHKTWMALDRDPELWMYFANRVLHILVDEFQDVNRVQYALMQGMAGERASVMAIGDPDQSIYGFRGASVEFITQHFARDFSPCKLLRLTNTWRYGHQTALLANHIIVKNIERDDKLTIATPANPDTRVTRLSLKPKQPSGLTQMLRGAVADGELHAHAMLVRYYSQSVSYEIELAAAKIPFHVYGREPLLLIPEIASLVAAMSLGANHWTVPPELRARFLGALLRSPTVFATTEVVERMSMQMDDALEEGGSAGAALLAACGQVEDAGMRERVRSRGDIIRMLEAGGMLHQPPAKIIDAYLMLSGFKANAGAGVANRAQVVEIEQNVNAFREMASRFGTTVELLDTLGPLAGLRADRPPPHDHLGIFSIHRAKGLEWDTVYLPGWSAGSFPRDGEPMEEERRLAYVAVTRAIKHLVFLHPHDQSLEEHENKLDVVLAPGSTLAASPFLYEAETGICAAAADAIRTGRTVSMRVRQADVLNRYMREAELPRIRGEVPPELARHFAQTSAAPNLVLKKDDQLRDAAGELYIVTSVVGDRYYYIRPMGSGEPRLISLNEAGWFACGP